MERLFPALLCAIFVLISGCESHFTRVHNGFGESFTVTDVSWKQDLSENGKTLRWEVQFKNTSDLDFAGPRGIGVYFLGRMEDVTIEMGSSAFIEEVHGGATHTIKGEIITDRIPDHAEVRFIR